MLSVKKLAFEIEGKKLLNGINFDVKRGAILGVLGKSGSGKSTLLKSIAGLIEYQRGSVSVDNDYVKKPSEKLIPGHEHIKIVRQDNPLFPNISLAENIAYPLRHYQKSYQKSRLNKLLRLTGIKAVASQLPRNVSEGEQQRAIIATALALEPKVLLLDEPFSNLDRENKIRLKNEIRDIVTEEQMACVFVTHDIDDVFGNADELAILKKGRISQRGIPEKVYKFPKSKYEGKITGALNEFQLDQMVYSRPEDVFLTEKEGYLGTVIVSKFAGAFYEIKLESNESSILMYSSDPIDLGKNVKFNFKRIIQI